ncbi:MAG: hypothetical protein IJA12_06255 [Oscillospiraceae bacterium]|nr:hypothetical protein [Oscillospiraceae bacterium]
MIIIIFIYGALGYWACGKTIYANKIRIGKATDLFLTRLIFGLLFGFVLIPVAVLKMILFR